MQSNNIAKNKQPLKVGFILDTSLDPNDGVQQYVLALGRWLASEGHDVHYLVGETKARNLPNIHSLSKNLHVSFNGNRTTIPFIPSKRKLQKFIRQENFDVLHVQTPHHPFLAQRLILAADSKTAVIGTFHILPYGVLASWATKSLGVWLRPSIKRINTMLAVSPAAAKFAKWAFGIDAEVLPNVVDYTEFCNAVAFPKNNPDKISILFLGRLVPRKGCLLLLEAAKILKESSHVKPFEIVICGKGPLLPKLKDYVIENGLEGVVTFKGFISEEDKPKYYSSADISVFPSSGGESFGIVLLEAMASGNAAVLAGDNPGYRSVLADRPELLFDPKSSKALADLLEKYITDASLRKNAALWGKKYTESFDIPTVGTKLVEIYQEALRKRRQQ